MYRKPALLLSSYNSLCLCPPKSSTSSNCWTASCVSKRKRGYATVADEDSRHWDERLHWPALKDAKKVPTPYEILRTERHAPYTKVHFHRLVKIYHPDLSSHAHLHASICHLPQHVRLERYRLIVAAHAILSDPERRRLYDRFGSGWAGRPDVPGFGFTRDPPKWSPDNDPMRNATWEDWERWYHRQEHGHRPSPLMSHGKFVSLIVMFAALGGIGQATRAQNNSLNLIEQRDAMNDRTHKDLMSVRKSAQDATRHERVESFLQRRDPAMYADEGLKRMLLEPDICESAHVEEGKGSYSKVDRQR
jgi:curved DNA-binding protein CbpA